MTRKSAGFHAALAATALAVCMLGAAPVLAAENHKDQPKHSPSAETMVLDGLILRPLGMAATAIGTGVFLATLPFTALGGNTGQAGRTLVADPAKYTFDRCLGCLSKNQFPYKDNPQ